ncbi:beta-propeller fold lactonase family protein [Ponticaulis profundi]|uniref:Beta-propeller fold lactonase family protein n=1 Tax=Ponticaulis profundi TaxID=2665222 RepID=A0ABW1S4H9_9PROT
MIEPLFSHMRRAGVSLGLAALLSSGAMANEQSSEDAGSTTALIPLEFEILTDADVELPRFKVDAAWPDMPAEMIIGQVPGLAVDKNDVVWLAHRPQSLSFSDIGLASDPPQAFCCKPGPTIMKFAQDGEYLGGWGGPETGPMAEGTNQWPRNVHGLYIDDDMSVWVGGNGDGDHVVLNFTEDGEFIRQIGTHGETDGNASETTLGNPADIWRGLGDVVIADGYINKRIVSFDDDALGFQGAWGAYATDPSGGTREGSFDQSQANSDADGGANPKARSFGDIVHCVVGTDDGHVYICDRRNNRAQLFKRTAAGEMEFVKDIVIAPETGGTRTVSDIAFSPDGKFIYMADMMNSNIWILDRESHEPLARIGRVGRYPGQFTWLHSVVVDSDGNIYTSEVGTGRRVQKLVFLGNS